MNEIETLRTPESVQHYAQLMREFEDEIMRSMAIPARLLSISERPFCNVEMKGDDEMSERRIIRGDVLDATVVVWEKFECDDGCRWTQTKGQDPKYWHVNKDGDECNFSGCKPGHFIHKRGETEDRKEAHDWFRDAHEEKGQRA
jgi:hypothetical protein